MSNKEERYCEIVGTKSKLFLNFKNKKIIFNEKKIYHINENKNQMYEDQLNFFFNNIKNKKKIILEKFNNASETVKFIKAIKLSNYKKICEDKLKILHLFLPEVDQKELKIKFTKNKNKTLLEITINQTKNLSKIHKIFLSTDSKK